MVADENIKEKTARSMIYKEMLRYLPNVTPRIDKIKLVTCSASNISRLTNIQIQNIINYVKDYENSKTIIKGNDQNHATEISNPVHDHTPGNDQDLKLLEVEVNISTEDIEDEDDKKVSSNDDNSDNNSNDEVSFNSNEDDEGSVVFLITMMKVITTIYRKLITLLAHINNRYFTFIDRLSQ
ncbi:hypothetical protein F8M41_017977 [Gigaspora margarita]|uniref:Uncharacterized protein n=1 Tax=Gigaspora margarita TaxID=4874 RepID=A0A8H4ELQ5_GIGMA|nr:hypothetical protein F8M41_017977 [Gigaspora margarita]